MSRSPLDAGRELCEVLGLDANVVQSIVIRWTANDLPRARVTLVAFEDGEVVRSVGRYRLEPITPKRDQRTLAATIGDDLRQLKAQGVPLI